MSKHESGNKHTPKHFVIQLGALASLYISITALLVVIFNVVNIQFPDAAESLYQQQSAREAVRMGIALLVVFFPTYLALTRVTNQTRRKESGGEYTLVTRWLIYFSLLVAGGVLLGDLVTLINYFLDGEITERFLIKVAALFVVVGAAFYYYVLDVRGYFTRRVGNSLMFGAGASVVVLVALVYGFTNIETPSEVREMRIDERQITDLSDMQYRVNEYYRTNQVLPNELGTLYPVNGVPSAPEGRPAYEYHVADKDAGTYELCATFGAASDPANSSLRFAMPVYEKEADWEHDAGLWCFARLAPQPIEE